MNGRFAWGLVALAWTSSGCAPATGGRGGTPDPERSPEVDVDGAAGVAGPDGGGGAAGNTVARDAPGMPDLAPGHRDCGLRALDPRSAWVEGVLGGALEIRRGWLECPQAPLAGRVSNELSVSLWVRATQFLPQHTALVARQLGAGREDYFFLGMLDRKLKVRSSLWAKDIVAAVPMPMDTWVHVAFTHDAGGMTRLYQDGKEVGQGRSASQRRAAVTAPITMGAGIDGPGDRALGQQFSGVLDEVAVWGRAVAPEEIAALAGRAQPQP
jgi:hypothetical protein